MIWGPVDLSVDGQSSQATCDMKGRWAASGDRGVKTLCPVLITIFSSAKGLPSGNVTVTSPSAACHRTASPSGTETRPRTTSKSQRGPSSPFLQKTLISSVFISLLFYHKRPLPTKEPPTRMGDTPVSGHSSTKALVTGGSIPGGIHHSPGYYYCQAKRLDLIRPRLQARRFRTGRRPAGLGAHRGRHVQRPHSVRPGHGPEPPLGKSRRV